MSGETGLLAILRTLVDHGVDFIVIGGVAVGHHGFPRATKDVDVIPATGRVNAERLWGALLELGAQPLGLGGLRHAEPPVPLTLDSLVDGANWDLQTRHGRLDLVQYREGAIETPADYDRLRTTAVEERHAFGSFWVVGYKELIDLKLLAGRDQDLIDVRAIREANEDTAP